MHILPGHNLTEHFTTSETQTQSFDELYAVPKRQTTHFVTLEMQTPTSDRPLHSFRASESFDRRTLCRLEMSIDGFYKV